MKVDSIKNNRIPTKWFNTALASLAAVENQQQLFDIAIDIKKQFGFNSIACGIVTQNNFRSEIYIICSDESEEWKQTYIQKEYWKIDTRIIVARNQVSPFYWSKLPQRAEFISNDVMQGVWDGITIPVHGPNHFFGFLHFTYSPEQKKISSWLQYIQPFIAYLAQQIISAKFALLLKELKLPLLDDDSKNSFVTLTGQQRKCLSWAAEGKTTEEIALILNISVSTVNKHLDSASVLLNANGRTHAIAKAIDGKLMALEYKKKSTIFYI
jgi:LuxR family transcriptional activator of bioluminescence operon